ncbi:hypothetical protein H2199_004663 [Coniosporium tulheliwenetii]|uniref:Uncharacterized protein n=1 Tax=Coniosporium tulheliwenetii TaxID=3383036 RepID=A0ACC2Z513_9PEZI|nr:hypothetical protein H2199_004663 [Cladosporium sp. JES 115]
MNLLWIVLFGQSAIVTAEMAVVMQAYCRCLAVTGHQVIIPSIYGHDNGTNVAETTSNIPFALEAGGTKAGSFIDSVLTRGVAKLGWMNCLRL